jgi:hypothetical protein
MVTRKLLILLVLAALPAPGILAQGSPAENKTQIPAATMESAYGQKLKVPGINNAGRLNGSNEHRAQTQSKTLTQMKNLCNNKNEHLTK